MATKKLRGPPGNRPVTIKKSRLPEKREKEIRRELEREFDKGLHLPQLKECDPQGGENKTLTYYLENEVEPHIRELAVEQPLYMCVGVFDKSRLTAINILGEVEGAGNASLKLYLDTTIQAVAAVAAINDNKTLSIYLARVGRSSDESVMLICGKGLTEEVKAQFDIAREIAWKRADLSRYTYTVEIPETGEKYQLDLEAFSQVLKHPEMVAACTSAISRPIPVASDIERGYVLNRLRDLENEEVAQFSHMLPKSLQGIEGIPEVKSPFTTNLLRRKVEKTDGGAFIDVKLGLPEKDARALLPISRITKKGFRAIFGVVEEDGEKITLFGLTEGNTYIGKAGTNSIVTPVVMAMDDVRRHVEEKHGKELIPANEGYFRYHTGLPACNSTADLAKRAIERRFHSDQESANLPFRVFVSVIDATDVSLSDVRSLSALKSLGIGGYPAASVDRANLVIALTENAKRSVQRRIFTRLAAENDESPSESLDYMNLIRRILDHRRTIRDAEDFIWVLRNDESLPEDIKEKKEKVAEWLFDFSWKNGRKMFGLLCKRVEEEVQKRVQKKCELLQAVK